MQSFTPLTTENKPSTSLHQRSKYPPASTSTSSPLSNTASPMSVLQPSHNTTASPADCRTSFLSIITPALRFSFDLAYTTQLLFTIALSFLLAHGLYATKVLAVNAYHASRIFLINAWHTLVFVAINLFFASRVVGIKTLQALGVATVFSLRSGSAVSGHGWVAASTALKMAWKKTERARARMFFEFMTLSQIQDTLANLRHYHKPRTLSQVEGSWDSSKAKVKLGVKKTPTRVKEIDS
ncbi:hypothetical protein GMDG_04308 [Pseudogymnoascus destructans 20631-21]|uniref:Uncharacterized protein n=1 Tax=Pseudogymnoascus destructans (strain ATCC MYA-4855 / 20631-21) TaxID=658429 RepID=L8G9A5_PSED2|nr:hypothetical protein GMDG_04308 [Pseudogymnoascus destructans 20631-21]